MEKVSLIAKSLLAWQIFASTNKAVSILIHPLRLPALCVLCKSYWTPHRQVSNVAVLRGNLRHRRISRCSKPPAASRNLATTAR